MEGIETVREQVAVAVETASALNRVIALRTVCVSEVLEEDQFFTTADERTTVTNCYNLEKAVPLAKKSQFRRSRATESTNHTRSSSSFTPRRKTRKSTTSSNPISPRLRRTCRNFSPESSRWASSIRAMRSLSTATNPSGRASSSRNGAFARPIRPLQRDH